MRLSANINQSANKIRSMDSTIIKKTESAQMQMLRADPAVMPILKAGDLVEVKLVERSHRGAFFEIPKIGIGIVYGIELMNAKGILKTLNLGDATTAKVVMPENENGFVELSLAEAGAQKVWAEIKELKEKDEPIKVKVVSANSGGLITMVNNVQAFLPASQLSNEHYPAGAETDRSKLAEELKKFVGQELEVKIISLNPRTGKFIVSEREIMSANVKELVAKYKVGDVVPGIISGVATFGAFVKFADNPSIEGLIHISELSHLLIDNPKDVIKVGDMVKAKIVEIKDGQVSLSLKALQTNPWDNIDSKFKAGAIVSGTVAKLNPFGAMVKLDAEISGLIHVSEFGSVEEMKKQLTPGQSYQFTIDSVKAEDKRIVLKKKQ